MNKTLLERCMARDGKETAAQIQAETVARLDQAAFAVATQTFRAFTASWEGSIAVAIGAYLDARRAKTEARTTFGPKFYTDVGRDPDKWVAAIRVRLGTDVATDEVLRDFFAAALAQDTVAK